MSKFFEVFRVIGRRTFIVFGLFTFLCVAVIAATYVISRHALKEYVEDQLSRIEWDIRVHQSREISTGSDILRQLRESPEVTQAESLVFLRSRTPPGVTAQADDVQVDGPWFVVLSATDPSLLPPEYWTEEGRTTLAFFGLPPVVQYYTERLQGAKKFSFLAPAPDAGAHHHGAAASHAHDIVREPLITLGISQVAQLDRQVLNRWFLEHTGTVSFVPFAGAALNIGNNPELVARFDSLFTFEMPQHEHEIGDDPGHEERAEYIPEITHVARVDRAAIISGWKLDESYRQMTALRTGIAAALPWEAGLHVGSDTEILLGKMRDSAQLIEGVTILLAFPLVIMAWVFAANLVRFVFLNERRPVGLMRLRGLSGSVLSKVVLSAVFLGGLVGGLAGLLVGTVAPLVAYEGVSAVPALIGIQRPLLAGVFLSLGLVMALVIGRRLAADMRRLTPGEAVHRFPATADGEASVKFTMLPALALVLGGYKFMTWWTGASLLDSWPSLRLFNVLLDFVAVPLLIYGFVVLVVSRKNLVSAATRWMSPLCMGRLTGLAVQEASKKTARVSGVFLVGSLAVATVLAPSIASHSFGDKALRGAKVQMGADAQMLFNPMDIAGQPQENLPAEVRRLQVDFNQVLIELRSQPGVDSATGLLKALIPMYVPGYGYNGVPLLLLTDPDEYLSQAYFEESLGVDQPFSEILARLQDGAVAVSPAIADFWRVRAGDRLVIGVDADDEPITVEVAGIVNALPGMPQRAVTDRDAFVTALSDYLNHLFVQEAFIVSAANNPALSKQGGLVPQMVALVRSGTELGAVQGLTLPVRGVGTLPQQLTRVKQDMYIFLVNENLSIYLVGGFVLVLSAIFAIFMVNYWEGRRTFALLRVRGSGPADLIGLLSLQLYAPLLWSLLVGGLAGVIAGYGIAHRLWGVQRVLTVLDQLPTHLVLSFWDPVIAVGMLALLSGLVVLLGFQVFRRSPREAIVVSQ